MNESKLSRRSLLHTASIVAIGAVGGSAMAQTQGPEIKRVVKKGRIKQSASRWCYRKLTLDQLCLAGAKIGLKGIDLLSPRDFPTLKKYGLICTMTSGGSDLIDKKKHKAAISRIRSSIEANAECGYPNVIALAGYGKGMSDDVGIANTVEVLKKVAGLAEKKKVNVCIEYLNSKVDHKGYMFDNMAWASKSASVSVHPMSRYSMTSTTRKSWKATLSAPSRHTQSSSGITTPAVIPVETK